MTTAKPRLTATTAMTLDMFTGDVYADETVTGSQAHWARERYTAYRARALTHDEAIQCAARHCHLRLDTVSRIVAK